MNANLLYDICQASNVDHWERLCFLSRNIWKFDLYRKLRVFLISNTLEIDQVLTLMDDNAIHIVLQEWLRRGDLDWTMISIINVYEKGSILRNILSQADPQQIYPLIVDAVIHGNTNQLNMLIDIRDLKQDIYSIAQRKNHTKILDWLRK